MEIKLDHYPAYRAGDTVESVAMNVLIFSQVVEILPRKRVVYRVVGET